MLKSTKATASLPSATQRNRGYRNRETNDAVRNLCGSDRSDLRHDGQTTQSIGSKSTYCKFKKVPWCPTAATHAWSCLRNSKWKLLAKLVDKLSS